MNPLTYAGLKVHILPETVEARRSWRERLFSMPWRPFLKMKIIPNPSAPGKDEVWKRGDRLIMRAATWHELQHWANVDLTERTEV